jgi:hypothetical protein
MKICEQIKADVFIYDPVVTFMGGVDERDNVKVRGVLDTFTFINRALGAASIVVHHFNKPYGDGQQNKSVMHRVRGASDFFNWADCVIALQRKSLSQAADAVINMTVAKTRALKEPEPFLIERSSTTFLHQRIEDTALCSAAKVAMILRDTFEGRCNKVTDLVTKAIELTNCSERTAKTAIKEAKAAKLIEALSGSGIGRATPLVTPEKMPGKGHGAIVQTELLALH